MSFVQFTYLKELYVDSALKKTEKMDAENSNKDDKNGSGLEESSFGTIPSYFGYQHDAVLGVSIDFTSNLRLQLEHHWVEGTARLTPVVLPNAAINDEEHWQMWAAQLMYWF